MTNLDLVVDGTLFAIELLIVVWVHSEVMELELFLDSFLEGLAFLQGQGVRLGDDGDDVDNIGEFLENDDINGLETVDVERSAGRYSWEKDIV